MVFSGVGKMHILQIILSLTLVQENKFLERYENHIFWDYVRMLAPLIPNRAVYGLYPPKYLIESILFFVEEISNSLKEICFITRGQVLVVWNLHSLSPHPP